MAHNDTTYMAFSLGDAEEFAFALQYICFECTALEEQILIV
jgi:hypothetical protein